MSSKYHRIGESQEIIVDRIEIGRDPACQVRFDESFTTVSRRHAAIVREGDSWKLIPLSRTNPVFLNKMKVQKEWFLQNGDEIQLAVNGPKLRFIVPAGGKSGIGSIGLSRRLSLFRRQALHPYKTAITALSIFLLLAIGGGVGYGIMQKNTVTNLEKTIAAATGKIVEQDEQFKVYQKEMEEKRQRDSIRNANLPAEARTVRVKTLPDLIAPIKNDVYYIETYAYFLNKTTGESERMDNACASGTGFVLDEGLFVTARHCVETWLFCNDDEVILANILATTYPDKFQVYSEIKAYSGTSLKFSIKSSDFKINRKNDIIKQVGQDDEGNVSKLRVAYPTESYGGAALMMGQDWATAEVAVGGALKADYETSVTLRIGEELHILGFPQRLGVVDESQRGVSPIHHKSSVAREGLDDSKCILASSAADHGNSGGPVFAERNGKLVVVGVVSRGNGLSDKYDNYVSIKQIKQ